MALGVVVVVGGVAAAAGGAAWAATRGGGGSGAVAAGQAPAALLPVVEQAPSGVAAPVPVPAASEGAGDGAGFLAEVAGKAADKALGKVVSNVVGSGVAGTLTLGFQVADAVRTGVTAIAGQGAGNISAVVSGAGVGIVVKTGVEAVGNALGIPAEFNHRIAQTVGVAAADPTGIVTAAKVTGELVSLGIRAVAGKEAERAVRDVVKKFDISDSRNAIHAPVAAVATAVSTVANVIKNGVGGLFGKLFGKK